MPSSCLEESYQFPCTYDDPRQRSQQLNGFSTEEYFCLNNLRNWLVDYFLCPLVNKVQLLFSHTPEKLLHKKERLIS